MHVLKEYKRILLAGIAVILFFIGAYFVMGHTEAKSKFTYAEHIFQEGTVSEIDIQIDEADWQAMLDNPLEEAYYRANLNINGEVVGNVAIRTKGNTSLTSVANSDSDRYSFKIDFDYYDNNGNYYGLKKLCLNNNYADNSYMREYIGYKVMEDMGLPVPACGYSHITVNGEEWGLYLAVEAVDEVFLQTRFADATGDLYKPEGMGGTGANLVYSSDNISDYTGLNLKTNLESSDGSEIIALMKALESGEGLEEVLDIDNALKYIAASVVLTNFDSYLGATTHNYYLYEENGVFSVIPWDINLAFGGFGGGMTDIYDPASGGMFGDRNNDKTDEAKEQVDVPQQSGGKENAVPRKQGGKDFLGMKGQPAKGNFPGMGEKTKTNSSPAAGEKTEMSNPSAVEEKTEKGNMPEMGNFPAIGGMPEMGDFSAMEGITSFSGGGKPLVDTLLVNEALLARYEDYLREFTEKYLTEEYMAAMVTEIHDLIAPYVEKDATAFYTYEEFEQGCSVDPEDEYSLVYYAVNMAESIQNQLAGGEPTFDASSLKGGGMGFGGGKGGMPAFGGDMKLPEGVELPDGMQFPFEGKMPSFGDGMEFTFGDEMPFDMTQQAEGQKEITEFSAESGQKIPFDKGEKGDNRGMPKDMPAGMPGFGGERQPQQIDIKEVLPKIAICGGVFCGGFIFVALYKRKKNLK